jgi:hypothetical protein
MKEIEVRAQLLRLDGDVFPEDVEKITIVPR